jgi:hypothetical protein
VTAAPVAEAPATDRIAAELLPLAEAVRKVAGAERFYVAKTRSALDELRAVTEEFEDADALADILAALDDAETAVETVEEHRDDPSGVTAEERTDARDEARESLETLADAIDSAICEMAADPARAVVDILQEAGQDDQAEPSFVPGQPHSRTIDRQRRQHQQKCDVTTAMVGAALTFIEADRHDDDGDVIEAELVEPEGAPLSEREAARLVDLEQIVSEGLDAFVQVAVALAEIHSARLYRATHRTFADYVAERWSMHRAHAYRMIAVVPVLAGMSPIDDIPLPSNEAQCRELARIPEGIRCDVWADVWNATDGRPTAKAVRSAYLARVQEAKAASARQTAEKVEGAKPFDKGPGLAVRQTKWVHRLVEMFAELEANGVHARMTGDTETYEQMLHTVDRLKTQLLRIEASIKGEEAREPAA